jgi:hypothetical protein
MARIRGASIFLGERARENAAVEHDLDTVLERNSSPQSELDWQCPPARPYIRGS